MTKTEMLSLLADKNKAITELLAREKNLVVKLDEAKKHISGLVDDGDSQDSDVRRLTQTIYNMSKIIGGLSTMIEIMSNR